MMNAGFFLSFLVTENIFNLLNQGRQGKLLFCFFLDFNLIVNYVYEGGTQMFLFPL